MSGPVHIRLLSRDWLLAAAAALWLLGSVGTALAQPETPKPATAQWTGADATAEDSMQGLRMDSRIEALTATGYQTALVAGLAGGVVLAGMAVGTHAAVLAGTAVLVGYVFLPWE